MADAHIPGVTPPGACKRPGGCTSPYTCGQQGHCHDADPFTDGPTGPDATGVEGTHHETFCTPPTDPQK